MPCITNTESKHHHVRFHRSHLTEHTNNFDASFTDKDVSDARDALWPVGECPGRNDSTKRSRRHALCCDIYDAMRQMDVADAKKPTYVVDPVVIGRIPKYSHEHLNVVAMDQRIRDIEK